MFALRAFDPLLVGAGRTVIAALVAVAAVLLKSRRLPRRDAVVPLLVVAAGCGIGFGVLSALALRHVSASHAAVVIGLLPVSTAVAAALIGGERGSRAFWVSSGGGALVVLLYALTEGAGSLQPADALLFLALVLAALGYATGGRLAREMPGYEVVAWGLVLALPVALPISLLALLGSGLHASSESLAGLLYVSLVSMFLGFIPWYRGLAAAGTARASQTQLVQPFLTVGWAILFLGERPGLVTLVAAALVGVSMTCSIRSRTGRRRPSSPARRTLVPRSARTSEAPALVTIDVGPTSGADGSAPPVGARL